LVTPQQVIGNCNSSYFVPNVFISNIPKEGANNFCLAEYIVYHEFYKVFILQDLIEGLKEISLAKGEVFK
jgi:hypothetical protein